jgi:uncharacterized membrane protein YheB (UPF0754 family)
MHFDIPNVSECKMYMLSTSTGDKVRVQVDWGNFWQNFWLYAFPILFYAFHGWGATWMALTMLFHPYEPKYIFGWHVPFTPGIFPARRSKLSQAVAGTITETLLTTSDIKAQVENLLTEQNIYLAVDGIVDVVLTEFRDITKLHRLANELSELSPAFLEQLVLAIIEGVEQRKNRHIAAITEKIFDQLIVGLRISRPQADEAATWIMDSIVTPVNVRQEMIRLLSPQNINSLEQSISDHASGPYKLLARIIGVKRVCYEWRNFLEKEPDQAEKIIADLLKHFHIEDQIATRIATFDLRGLPLQTVEKIKQQSVSLVEEFLVAHKEEILQAVKNIQGPAVATVQSAILRFNPESLKPEWLHRAKENMASFVYGYLKKELGGLLEKAIPELGVYGMIARKIEVFTPQQLEQVIKRICHQELRMLELLGAFIGLWLGCIQATVNYFTHQYHH